jgi:aspartyl-tRNA(Asn)/glutamyl-tRNA(Gln) amidotransferase subunit C
MAKLTNKDIKKIARLARLDIAATDIPGHAENLSKILNFVEQINRAATGDIKPAARPQDGFQHLRHDAVTEINNRELFQKSAPEIEAGLYLVPKVIEACDALTLLSPKGREDNVPPLPLGEGSGVREH